MNGYVICDKNSTEEINCELYKSKVEIRNKQKRILVSQCSCLNKVRTKLFTFFYCYKR